MKIEEFSRGHEERLVLAGMILSREVLARIAPSWSEFGLFPSSHANLIGAWCVKYLRKYDNPPGIKTITSLFAGWCTNPSRSEATVKLVDSFITSITEEYPDGLTESPGFILDTAGRLFKATSLERLRDQMSTHLELGEVDKAQEAYDSHRPLQIGQGSFVDLYQDEEAMREALDDSSSEVLVRYPGDLGKFYGDSLARSCFISYMAPEKRGKTAVMLDLAYTAMTQRRRVAFFEVGDLSRKQINRRFMVRACKNPLKHRTLKIPSQLKVTWEKNEAGFPAPKIDTAPQEKEFLPLPWDKVRDRIDKVMRCRVKSKKPYLKIYTYPAGTVTVGLMESLLKEQISLGWVADVVCIAQGSQVLTDRGLVSIERIRCNDRLWDGCQWVSHGGLVYKGERDVISYAGLTATPDHLVFSEQGWRTLESCSRLGLRIAQTGVGGQGIQFSEGYFVGGSGAGVQVCQQEGLSLHCQEGVRSRSLYQVWDGEMGSSVQHQTWTVQGVSVLPSTETIPELVVFEGCGCPAEVSEPQLRFLATLWWKGNRIPFFFREGRMFVDFRELRRRVERYGNRPHQQRRALRTRQFALVNQETELFSHQEKSYYPHDSPVSPTSSQSSIRRRHASEVFSNGNAPGTDCCQVEIISEKIRRGKAPVWDILNAGPLHRFTVQGFLVHNCVDYADLLTEPGFDNTRDRTNEVWTKLRALSQKLDCLVVTATQADAASYSTHTLGMKNFSEDKRKLAHVTGMVGINQTEEEKKMGVLRHNWVVLREDEFHVNRCVYLAGCLGLGRPVMYSSF